MADLVPRDFFRISPFRLPSLVDFDDVDDLLSTSQLRQTGLSISEDDKNIYVEAAVPGLDPKDIEVTYDRGVLWIKGEVKEEEKKGRKIYRQAETMVSYRVA